MLAIKGKGEMRTFWVEPTSRARKQDLPAILSTSPTSEPPTNGHGSNHSAAASPAGDAMRSEGGAPEWSNGEGNGNGGDKSEETGSGNVAEGKQLREGGQEGELHCEEDPTTSTNKEAAGSITDVLPETCVTDVLPELADSASLEPVNCHISVLADEEGSRQGAADNKPDSAQD